MKSEPRNIVQEVTQPPKLAAPGKPVIFHPGVDPVPVPDTVPQHPQYSKTQAAVAI